jgi:dUTP pyrophosphatase
MEKKVIKCKRLDERAKLPVRANPTDAGMDIFCLNGFSIFPEERLKVSTGIALEIPHGFYVKVAEKSGLASKGIEIKGGIIDEPYRGEIIVVMKNGSDSPIIFESGDKIAQLILSPVEYGVIVETNELSDTERGNGGFGSTGK